MDKNTNLRKKECGKCGCDIANSLRERLKDEDGLWDVVECPFCWVFNYFPKDIYKHKVEE